METRSIKEHGHHVCLESAVSHLQQGRVVCFPTDTFYALGARYDREDALNHLAQLKSRPHSKAFPLIIGEMAALSSLVTGVDPITKRIIRMMWPAPLTVIFQARDGLFSFIKDERNTVAVRMPSPSFALDLAKMMGVPITATSANISGMPPAESAEDVLGYFPQGIDLLIDGGQSGVNLPSTIIEVQDSEVKILREGMVPLSDIQSVI